MSTPRNEMGQWPVQPPDPFYKEETGQQAKDPQQFPPQPSRPPGPTRKRWFLIAAISIILVLILGIQALILMQLGQRPGEGQVRPTATATGSTEHVTPTVTDATPPQLAGVTPGPQPGPISVKDPSYWDKILGTQSGVNKVERVSFASIMGTPTLQAVVMVRYNGADTRLDVYAFNNITNAKPTQIFKLTGLVKGDARISRYNTIMTAEVDKSSTLNSGKAIAAMTPDLFREFDWSAREEALAQTVFPGIFPDLTRYQAEADQARVDKGQDTWKNDPVRVAQAFETKFLNWQRDVKATLINGGGARDVSATVRLQEPAVPNAQIKVTLSRLEGDTHNFWVVTAMEDDTLLTLKNVEPHSLITSPVTLEGTGSAFEAEIGQAIIYDHLYNDIGHAKITATTQGMGQGAYSTRVVYTTGFHQGAQEGLAAVYEKNGGLSDEIVSAVMVKVLLNPEPGIALGALPCPDTVKNPSYWTPFLNIPPNPGVADSVSCGNLLGQPGLQAMVVAHEIVGGGPLFRSVSLFDKITDPKPQLLFTVGHLLHGEASISMYSTIMTGEVDLNSPLNKGKADSAMTMDLFREFKWSMGAAKFVQVAFPGIYPDLTRYQAEQDQRNVNGGQDSWKGDAKRVAQNMAEQLLKWSPGSQASIVSGGGAQDVNAVIQVKSASPDHPVINVTLSRLAGDIHNLWEVIAVSDGSAMSISSPTKWEVLSSPVTVKGTGSAFEGDVGTIFVLDHLYTDIGHARGVPAAAGQTTFTATVPYTSGFQGGTQEGVLALYDYSYADGAIAGVVMVKILISQ